MPRFSPLSTTINAAIHARAPLRGRAVVPGKPKLLEACQHSPLKKVVCGFLALEDQENVGPLSRRRMSPRPELARRSRVFGLTSYSSHYRTASASFSLLHPPSDLLALQLGHRFLRSRTRLLRSALLSNDEQFLNNLFGKLQTRPTIKRYSRTKAIRENQHP